MSDSLFDWSGCDLVHVDPEIHSGDPVVKGTRVPADAIVTNFLSGSSIQQVAEDYPSVGLVRVEILLTHAQVLHIQDAA